MNTISKIRRELRTVITTGLEARGIAAEAHVTPAPAEYDAVAMTKAYFHVTVIVGIANDERAEQVLDVLLDPDDGAKAMLEADRQLDGLVADLAVPRSTGYQLLAPDPDPDAVEQPSPRLAATWVVAVYV